MVCYSSNITSQEIHLSLAISSKRQPSLQIAATRYSLQKLSIPKRGWGATERNCSKTPQRKGRTTALYLAASLSLVEFGMEEVFEQIQVEQ